MISAAGLREAFESAERAVVFGDLHADYQAFRSIAEQTAEMNLAPVMLSVGDFGIGPWGSALQDKTLKRADELLDQLDMFVALTPGNHENWSTIDGALEGRRDDLGFGILGHHGRIRVSPRGHRFNLGGRRFGSIGGAVSVDRGRRTPGRTWWPQEVPTAADVAALGTEPLDVLITHEVPAGALLQSRLRVHSAVAAEADATRELLARAVQAACPRLCFAGHWHIRLSSDIVRPDGGVTTVEVLSEEHTTGNAVALDIDELSITGLPTLWRRHLDR